MSGQPILETGPVFVVGASRSGTKLVRDVLNRHLRVGIPTAETHFIPYLVARCPAPAVPEGQVLRHLVRVVGRSMFVQTMARRGVDLDRRALAGLFDGRTMPEGVGGLMRHCVEVETGETAFDVWGDKTPDNLLHMAALRAAFPGARFVHIIRDPRDRAVSARAAWGADPKLSVERWRTTVAAGRSQGRGLGDAYHEIRYEDLTAASDVHIAALCGFLGFEFEEGMLELSTPTENLGDRQAATHTATRILRNSGRFRTEFSAEQIARLDQIGGMLAAELGYGPESGAEQVEVPLTRKERRRALPRDRIQTVRHHMTVWGPVAGLRHLGWRRRVLHPSRPSVGENR